MYFNNILYPMKKALIVAILGLISTTIHAQSVQDLGGRVFKETNSSNISGTPYISNNWSKGTILTTSNQLHKDMEIKYDLFNKILLFKNKTGEVLQSSIPVKEFTVQSMVKNVLVERLFRSGYLPTADLGTDTFYEVLYNGDVQFLKLNKKVLFEEREYSGTTVKTYQDKISYFIALKNNAPELVNKNAASVVKAIGDREAELNDYIKNQKLNLRDDADIIKLLSYYTSITSK